MKPIPPHTTRPKPNAQQIAKTIELLQARMAKKGINSPKNSGVKEGYTMALKILQLPAFAWQPIDVTHLEHMQARAIGLLAIDYLNGDTSQRILVNVPIL